jgi:flagellar hook-associated protein 3 FlgL
MIRITESMIFSAVSRDMNRAQLLQYEAQLRATSGRRVQKASDDPVAANRATVFQTGLNRLEAMGRVADRAEVVATTSETALAQAIKLIDDAREIARTGASDPTSAQDRDRMASVVDALRDHMRDLGNTEVDGEYIFAGYRTGSPPFLTDGSFVGDGGVREVEVAPEITAVMNSSGEEAFTAAGGEDILALLRNLRDDLIANDEVAIRNRLSALDAAREQLARVHAGAAMNLRIIQEASDARRTLRESFLSAQEAAKAADATESYVELLQAQNSLEATTTVASRILDTLKSGL